MVKDLSAAVGSNEKLGKYSLFLMTTKVGKLIFLLTDVCRHTRAVMKLSLQRMFVT